MDVYRRVASIFAVLYNPKELTIKQVNSLGVFDFNTC
jgi:hypothetical protein